MGVRNWKGLLHWSWQSLEDISVPILAIDFPNYMSRRLSVFSNPRNPERIPTEHVSILVGIVRASLRANVFPVFVFDGPPEALKRRANPELVLNAHRLYRRFCGNGTAYDEDIAYDLRTSPALRLYFAAEHVKDLCSLCGIPGITAPSEAELFAAVLCRERKVGTVVSNDADTILFGSPHATRALELTQGRIESTTLASLISETTLTPSQLRDLAVLSGCDFHSGVKGIGPRKGTVLLRRHGDLQSVLRHLGVSFEERDGLMRAREVFDEGEISIHVGNTNFTLSPPLPSRLVKMLSLTMNEDRAEKITRDLVWSWKDFGNTQSTLESFVR